jgi:hypothetical protein
MRSIVQRGASLLVLSALTGGASTLAAQATPANPYTAVSRWTPPPLPAGKKPITQDTYDEWRGISGATLSNDGKWAVYSVGPVIGEGEVVARSTAGSTEYKAARGYTGRPQLQPSADSAALFSAAPAQVSADSRFVVFTVYPPRADVERARARRGATPPRNGMGIMNLADGTVTRIANVRSFRLARDGGRFLAYQLEDTAAAAGRGAAPGAPAARAARRASRGSPTSPSTKAKSRSATPSPRAME